MWKNPNARCDHRNVHIEFCNICEGDCWIQKTAIAARRKNENPPATPPAIATPGEWDVGEVLAFWPLAIGAFAVFGAPDLLGFIGAEQSLELKDGVIGGEDDDEEGEVSEPAELETGRVGEDEERGEWVAVVQGGWGVREYLQLDWMDDGTDGWMEKASRPRRPLIYVIRTRCWFNVLLSWIGLLTSFPTLVSTTVKSSPMLFLSYGWWIEIWETWPRIQPPSVRFSFLSSPPLRLLLTLRSSHLLFSSSSHSNFAVCLLLESGSRIFLKKFNKTFATKVPAFFQQRAIEEGWSNQGFRS